MSRKAKPLKMLVVFNTIQLYGMEKAVLGAFELLRPEVEPHFVLTQTAQRKKLPIFQEIRRLGFSYDFLSDHSSWPKLAKPKSLSHFYSLLWAFVRGNLDVFLAFRRSGCRAVLFPSSSYALFGLMLALWCRLRRLEVMLVFYDLTPHYDRLLRWQAPLISTFVHSTETGREITLKANPCLKQKRNVVVSNRPPRRPPVSQEAPFESGKRALVFLGQVAPHKGLDFLIEAFNELSQKEMDIELHVLGEGDPEYVRHLKQLAGDQLPRVHFWGFRADAERFLAAGYVHVFPTPPSRFLESFGNVALEAMAHGVPTVTFAAGGVTSIVSHGKTGLVVPEETVEALAAAISIFLSDPNLRDQMGERARLRYEEKFSDRLVRSKWFQILGVQ